MSWYGFVHYWNGSDYLYYGWIYPLEKYSGWKSIHFSNWISSTASWTYRIAGNFRIVQIFKCSLCFQKWKTLTMRNLVQFEVLTISLYSYFAKGSKQSDLTNPNWVLLPSVSPAMANHWTYICVQPIIWNLKIQRFILKAFRSIIPKFENFPLYSTW